MAKNFGQSRAGRIPIPPPLFLDNFLQKMNRKIAPSDVPQTAKENDDYYDAQGETRNLHLSLSLTSAISLATLSGDEDANKNGSSGYRTANPSTGVSCDQSGYVVRFFMSSASADHQPQSSDVRLCTDTHQVDDVPEDVEATQMDGSEA